jgi:hypothetical protein
MMTADLNASGAQNYYTQDTLRTLTGNELWTGPLSALHTSIEVARPFLRV